MQNGVRAAKKRFQFTGAASDYSSDSEIQPTQLPIKRRRIHESTTSEPELNYSVQASFVYFSSRSRGPRRCHHFVQIVALVHTGRDLCGRIYARERSTRLRAGFEATFEKWPMAVEANTLDAAKA